MVKKAKNKLLTKSFLVTLGVPTVFIPGLILASILGWDWRQDLGNLKSKDGFNSSEQTFPLKVKVTKVVDGDTFETDKTLAIRMIGIDAPDRGEKGYQEAKDYLEELILGEEVSLEYDRYQDDKYGRILAYVFEDCTTQLGCSDGRRMLNWLMLEKNLAEFTTYKDRGNLKYQELLESAN